MLIRNRWPLSLLRFWTVGQKNIQTWRFLSGRFMRHMRPALSASCLGITLPGARPKFMRMHRAPALPEKARHDL
jgi:hypothetical protein